MCGIAGIITPDGKSHENSVRSMLQSMSHRGPDDRGVMCFDTCVLGHARLSIIDIQTGHQPMLAASGRSAIIFNGEIYGYREIKKTINNYPFASNSDTEVILALYEKYGRNLLDHLPGMFAFAIWDNDKDELFCARDRFGEKPFYYAFGTKGEFIFASEIKGILASGLVRPVLDMTALSHYLKRLYIHPTETIYKNIFVLPPAHSLTLKGQACSVNRYWELPAPSETISLHDAVTQFTGLFDKAVENCMIADVPVGIFLSGGLDSSSIVASAAKSNHKLNTFAFGFGETINELPFALAVAKQYHTEHIELQDNNYNLVELLKEMQTVFDEPFADSSNIPTYLISKEARKYVKVVLGGDGGDELLAGYSFWYRNLHNIQLAGEMPPKVITALACIDQGLKKLGIQTCINNIVRGKELRKYYTSVGCAHDNQNVYFTEDEISSLGLKTDTRASQMNRYPNGSLDDALRTDLQNYMPGDILVKIDRASMANSLELRAPFLDVDLASFCISLPARLKISCKSDKLVMRRAFNKRWPSEIRKRGKQGFGAPVDRWLQIPEMEQLKMNYLGKKANKMYELLSFEECQKWAAMNNYKSWILLVLSLWMENRDFVMEN